MLEMDIGVVCAGYAGQQLLAASLLDEVCGKVGCSFIAGMGDNFYPCVSALHLLDPDVKVLLFPFFAYVLMSCLALVYMLCGCSAIIKGLTSNACQPWANKLGIL